MITFFLGAALLGLFLATVVAVFAACLEVYDWVLRKLTGAYKALKVLIQGRDGKVSGGALVQRGGQYEFYPDPKMVKVSGSEIDDELKRAFDRTITMNSGDKMVEFKPDPAAEAEIRRRAC